MTFYLKETKRKHLFSEPVWETYERQVILAWVLAAKTNISVKFVLTGIVRTDPFTAFFALIAKKFKLKYSTKNYGKKSILFQCGESSLLVSTTRALSSWILNPSFRESLKEGIIFVPPLRTSIYALQIPESIIHRINKRYKYGGLYSEAGIYIMQRAFRHSPRRIRGNDIKRMEEMTEQFIQSKGFLFNNFPAVISMDRVLSKYLNNYAFKKKPIQRKYLLQMMNSVEKEKQIKALISIGILYETIIPVDGKPEVFYNISKIIER